MIFKVLFLFSSSVYSALIPGNNVNFVTKSGYKYSGVPEVDTRKLSNGQTIKNLNIYMFRKLLHLRAIRMP